MLLSSTQIGLAGLGGASGAAASQTAAAAIAAQPQMAGLVDEAAAAFMWQSPEALNAAKEALPKNPLLARSPAQTFQQLEDTLRNPKADHSPSTPAKIASGIISTAIALSSTIAGGILVYQQTGNPLTAGAAVGLGAVVGAGFGAAGAAGAGAGVSAAIAAVSVAAISAVSVAAISAVSVAAIAAGAGVSVGVGAGAIALYPRLARFLDGPLSFVTQKSEARQLQEVGALLGDPTEIEHFFAEHPDQYLSFLRESVSEAFRGKEAEAKIRIDALRAKVEEAERKQEERLREIAASNISEIDKPRLSDKIKKSTQAGVDKLNEAIREEEAFVKQLNAFIDEVAQMANNIRLEVAARDIYAAVEQHAAEMEALAETAIRAEEERLESLFDLARYWQRLREMGDEVIHLQLAHQEISQALLEAPTL